MSKLAKMPVIIREGVTVTIQNNIIKVSGPKGNLNFNIPAGVDVKVVDGRGIVSLKDKNNDKLSPVLGLTRATLANLVAGAHTGFEKKLELSGVGYRAQADRGDLSLSVGFSHPVLVAAIPGISFSVLGKNFWLWLFRTNTGDIFLVIRPTRGNKVLAEVLGEFYPGVVHCDCWRAYDFLKNAYIPTQTTTTNSN